MAVLAIAAVGGLLSSSVGLSFSLGFSIFGTVAGALLAPHPQSPTFRAGTSVWGQTWPIVYNSGRIAGNVIQEGPIIKQTDKLKKGNIKCKQTFAVGFCEGEHTFGRIWADGIVIYDPRPITAYTQWSANATIGAGDYVIPVGGGSSKGDRIFIAQTDGVTGSSEPTWNTNVNAITYDGTVTWLCQKIGKQRKVGQQYNYTMRLYTGSEDQLADSALEELVGTGNQPAYRGLMYAVFETFDESRYGNRKPNIEAEIITNVSTPEVFVPMLTSGPDVGTTYEGGDMHPYGVCIDWANRYVYHFSGFGNYHDSGTGDDYDIIFRARMSDGVCDGIFDLRTVTSSGSGNQKLSPRNPFFWDGYLYMFTTDQQVGYPRTGDRLSKIRVSDMKEVAAYDFYARVHGWGSGDGMTTQLAIPFTHGGINYALLCQTAIANPRATEIVNLDTMTGVYADATGNLLAPHSYYDSGVGLCWIENGASTVSFGLFMENEISDTGGNGFVWGKIEWDYLTTFTVTWYSHLLSDIDPSNNHVVGTCGGICSDGASVLVGVTVGENLIGGGSETLTISGYLVKMDLSGNILWAVPNGVGTITTQALYWFSNVLALCDYSAGTFAYLLPPYPDAPPTNEENIQIINTDTGAVTLVASLHVPNQGYQWNWNSTTGELIFWSNGWNDYNPPLWVDGWAYYKPGAEGAKLSLGDICADVSSRVGLQSSDYDYSALDSVFPTGSQLMQRGPARSFLESMQPAFFFDLTEIGPKMVGSLRSAATVTANIPDADLGATDGTDKIVDKLSITRINDLEIPRDLAVTYYDYNHDYQQGSQEAPRSVVTNYSSGHNTLTVPVTMTPQDAVNAAQRSLYLTWMERDAFKLSVPIDYIGITPADLISVTRGSETFQLRVSKVTLQPTAVIDIEAVSEDLGLYSATVPAPVTDVVTGSFSAGQVNPVVTPVLAVMDTAALRSDDLQNPGLYLAGCASDPDGAFDFETAQVSPDDSVFTDAETINVESVMGTTATTLGDCSRWTVFDEINTVQVTLLDGTLSNASKDDLINGLTNLCWFGNGELAQFMNADLIDATTNTWQLSNWLRARLGTEQFTGTHTIGEQFVLLDDTAAVTYTYGASEIGATPRYWRGMNDAATDPITAVQTITQTTRRLLPYAPYYLKASRDMSGNVTITGLRRTRWHGTPLWTPPETDTPVTMEIDIKSGSTVLRTLKATLSGAGSGITDPSAFTAYYAAADQVTDFGSTQAAISIVAYQLNALAGRGYGKAATL